MNKKIIVQLLVPSIVFMVIILASVIINYPGVLHPEVERRLPLLLDSRPILTKIFDVNVNDFTWYQARELSYVFEIAEAYGICVSAHLGFPHFLSVVHYLSMFFIAVLTVFISCTFFKQKHVVIPLLFGVFFLTSPAAFLGVYFNRNSKEVLSLILVILTAFLLRYLINKKTGVFQKSLIFFASVTATLLDRQGFFIITWLTCLFFLIFIGTKQKSHGQLFLLFFLSTIVNILYNFLIGPILIHTFVGYWPDFSYQRGTENTLTNTMPVNYTAIVSWSHIVLGLEYLVQTFSLLLGSLNRLLLIPLLVFISGLFYLTLSKQFPEHIKNRFLLTASILISSIASIIVLYCVMLMRHPGMIWPDVVGIFYMLPVYSFFIIGLNFITADSWIYIKRYRYIVILVLLFISISNIVSLPKQLSIMKNGYLQEYFFVTPKTIECIKNPSQPISNYDLPWKNNEILCETLRK